MKFFPHLVVVFCLASNLQAQERHSFGESQVTYPEVSKYASISQNIGITNIKIDYHRPRTFGRNIWDVLVPYGKVWRAGANESTRISFTDDVEIEGKKLKAGIYGLHMIPNKDEWTVIFSTNYTQWGSFYYDENEDALRVTVTPEQVEHQEALKYEFIDLQDSTATIALIWDKIKVPFRVSVNQHETVIAEFNRNLRTLPRFRWFGNREAALYCVINKTHYDEAMVWIDRSLRFEEKFANMIVKADLLRLQGNTTEADQWEQKAVQQADTIDWLAYGYETLGHHGRIDRAIETFKRGIAYYPDSYVLHRSIGDAYGKSGNIEMAKKSFKRAGQLARTEEERDQLQNYMNRYFLK